MILLKNATTLVSRILFLNYHLSGRAITGVILLPTLERVCRKAILGRAALKRSYTWHYSTQGLPFSRITAEDCELLPHIFTFSARIAAGSSYFLWHFLFSAETESRRLTGRLLFAVRTFLCVNATIARGCNTTKIQ